jgi:serine/threonine protein kinase
VVDQLFHKKIYLDFQCKFKTKRIVLIKQNSISICFSDTCEGLTYLEQNHIVHRDVAASNVLIADDNTAKVADFGLAKFVETTGKENGNKDSNENLITTEKIKCRTKWTAPEALESKVYFHLLRKLYICHCFYPS